MSANELDQNEPPGVRLDRLLRSNGCIVFEDNLPDREFPHVKCSIFGAPKTNELFVQLSNGKVSFVGVAVSELLFPVMADRVFGIDAADHAVAFELADRIWDKNRAALISK